jgi:hypothetical protein
MVIKMQMRLMLVFILAMVLSSASNSFAAIYKYIDNNGIICFADDLQSIPEQCRATAKIVSGEQEEVRKLAIQQRPEEPAAAMPGNASSSDQGTVSIKGHAKSLFSGRVLISAVVVVSALFAFVILGIIDADHRKAIKFVRVVIMWGMSVYLLLAHAGDAADVFRSLQGKVDTVQRESEEKGKRAARSMKEINGLMQHIDNTVPQVSEGVDPEKRD